MQYAGGRMPVDSTGHPFFARDSLEVVIADVAIRACFLTGGNDMRITAGDPNGTFTLTRTLCTAGEIAYALTRTDITITIYNSFDGSCSGSVNSTITSLVLTVRFILSGTTVVATLSERSSNNYRVFYNVATTLCSLARPAVITNANAGGSADLTTGGTLTFCT